MNFYIDSRSALLGNDLRLGADRIPKELEFYDSGKSFDAEGFEI